MPNIRVEIPSKKLSRVAAAALPPGALLAALLAAPPCLAQAAATAAGYGQGPAIANAENAYPVQIYGTLDAALRHVDEVSKAGAVTQFASGLNTSRIGFRGLEQIDHDLRGTFRLEQGLNLGTGDKSNSTTFFDRTATVGLGWKEWDVKLGRQEGFGYESAAAGLTDPLSMALNLPNPASPAAAGSKAPVLGANPLQAVYSYTYGQLRFNNVLRVSTDAPAWSAGAFAALGGVAGSASANSAKGGHLGARLGPTRWEVVFQQSVDAHGVHSDLGAVAGTWEADAWKVQAGVHQLRVGAGFDSAGLGNGASGSSILGSSTTVAAALASARQDFRFTVADVGTTWKPAPAVPLTLAAYRTRSDGAGPGASTAVIALGKWYVSRKSALYLEVDHAVSSGTLGAKTVSTGASELAYMAGINTRF